MYLSGLLICEECGTTYRRISKPPGKCFGNAECNQEDDYICITDMAKTKSGVSRTAGYSIGTDISKAQAGDIILT